jgi:hypothetical protein
MVSIFHGLHLWRQSSTLKKRNIWGLWENMWLVGRMWSRQLVCSLPGGLLFYTLLEHRAVRWCSRWWLLVWLCTTWSLRTSVVISCLTKGDNFRVNWLSPLLSLHASWDMWSRHLQSTSSGVDWAYVGSRRKQFVISSHFVCLQTFFDCQLCCFIDRELFKYIIVLCSKWLK